MATKTFYVGITVGFLLTAGHPPESQAWIPIQFLPQQGENLCWAATTQIVINYAAGSTALQQCQLVDIIRNQTTSCCTMFPPGYPDTWMTGVCNQQAWPPIRRVAKHNGLGFWDRDSLNGKVPWNQAIAELDAGRPFIFTFNYLDDYGNRNPNQMHALVAYGYSKAWYNAETNNMDSALVVWDPFGVRDEEYVAAGDAYFLSYLGYDYGVDRFTNEWYGDGPSWSHIR